MLRLVWIATEPEYVVHEAKAEASAEATMVVVPRVLQSAAAGHVKSAEALVEQVMIAG